MNRCPDSQAPTFEAGLTRKDLELQLDNLSASYRSRVAVAAAQQKEILKLQAGLSLSKTALIDLADVLGLIRASGVFNGDDMAEIAKWEAKSREVHADIIGLGSESPEERPAPELRPLVLSFEEVMASWLAHASFRKDPKTDSVAAAAENAMGKLDRWLQDAGNAIPMAEQPKRSTSS